jgi:hypothetical protein
MMRVVIDVGQIRGAQMVFKTPFDAFETFECRTERFRIKTQTIE